MGAEFRGHGEGFPWVTGADFRVTGADSRSHGDRFLGHGYWFQRFTFRGTRVRVFEFMCRDYERTWNIHPCMFTIGLLQDPALPKVTPTYIAHVWYQITNTGRLPLMRTWARQRSYWVFRANRMYDLELTRYDLELTRKKAKTKLALSFEGMGVACTRLVSTPPHKLFPQTSKCSMSLDFQLTGGTNVIITDNVSAWSNLKYF